MVRQTTPIVMFLIGTLITTILGTHAEHFMNNHKLYRNGRTTDSGSATYECNLYGIKVIYHTCTSDHPHLSLHGKLVVTYRVNSMCLKLTYIYTIMPKMVYAYIYIYIVSLTNGQLENAESGNNGNGKEDDVTMHARVQYN